MEVNLHHSPINGITDEELILAIFVATVGYNSKSIKEITKIVQNLPREKNNKVSTGTSIDINNLIPEKNNFYTYKGSLPYPPCTRNYIWIIYENPIVMTTSDHKTLKELIFNNVRRLFPEKTLPEIGNRQIYYNNNTKKIKLKKTRKLKCRLVTRESISKTCNKNLQSSSCPLLSNTNL